MLSISHLSIQFGGKFLFDDVSFLINKTDRIGLVGKNGAGKSTLLKILAGRQIPESGDIARPSDFTLGYLPQEMNHQGGKTVFEETLTAFASLLKLQEDIERMTDEMTHHADPSSDEFMDLLTHLHDAQEKFGMHGGYNMEGETEKILLGLGFLRADFERQTETFSGGWRMRIELAKILLQAPDLLLLDEPTNHLDIESIQWLEDFLKNYSGALVLVSHDRIFLDTVTNRTIEITLGKIEDYRTSYSRYVELRAERREMQKSAYDNQQKTIADMERFVERFKAKASKATQAQSRVKALEKIDRIEIEDEDNSAIRFYFPEPPRSGKVMFDGHNLTKRYDEKLVLDNIEFEVEREDRIAFVGKNGEGKSTLSKILAGIEPSEGKLNYGHNVKIGYYAQNQAEELDGNKTVFQTIDDVAAGEMRLKVRALLGAFLFSGDAIDKKVRVLSGGEKARLAMCKLLLEPVNLLIMDEPTNHLDMRSKDILKEALIKYEGALIIVSHDRDFLQGLTSKVFEFRNKKLKLYYGDVYSYLADRKIENLDALNATKAQAKAENLAKPVQAKAAPVAPKNNLSKDERRQLENKKKKVERSIGEAEAQIEELETQKASLEKSLNDSANLEKQTELLNMYQNVETKLASQMKTWEDLQEEFEGINAELK
ncbi:MAG: ABC transporter ATP-binding protein [Sphingobacteriales bacterium]|nr:MAG: ABC transporter ATP-binding protein [Sphingobacteriales bacterium]